MVIQTRHFGEIDLDESKVIYFENGILGFEECKKYTILYDDEDGKRPDISWLQSLDEVALAIPIISPFLAKTDYNPDIEDELLKSLGELKDDNLAVFVSITVPNDIEKITANLKAPFIINTTERKGVQVIVENPDYEVKYKFHEQLKQYKASKGGE